MIGSTSALRAVGTATVMVLGPSILPATLAGVVIASVPPERMALMVDGLPETALGLRPRAVKRRSRRRKQLRGSRSEPPACMRGSLRRQPILLASSASLVGTRCLRLFVG